MDSESTSADSARPIPPRYWWLKRIVIGIAILLIALGSLRWWWGVKAHRALQDEIDRSVATGQPVFPEDFRTPSIPDDQNAAILLKQAAAALSLTKAQERFLGQFKSDIEKYYANTSEVQHILERAAPSLALVRQSRQRASADWGWSPRDLSTPSPSLQPYNNLLAVLGLAAIDAHSRGNDAEAVEILHDMLSVGKRFQSMSILLASLFEDGATARVTRILADCGPHLRIGIDKDEPSDTAKPATRRQVEDLIADLLNDRESRQAFQRSFYAERLVSLDAITIMTRGGYSLNLAPATGARASLVSFLLRPMFELDGVQLLRYMTAIAEAAGAPDWPTASRRLPAPVSGRQARGLAGVAHFLSLVGTPSFQGVIEGSFRTSARRRMAAVALAVRLYESDHGRLPEQLGQLIPRYVPVLPLDPFADDSRSIGYRATSDPPVVYSVGPPAGKAGAKPEEVSFPLRAKPPATAPSGFQTRPVNR